MNFYFLTFPLIPSEVTSENAHVFAIGVRGNK